jgi:hypothetical protein
LFVASQSFPLTPDGGRMSGPKLARILKALRRHRGLRPPEVARRMAMPLRSYEHFEGGRGQLNVARIARFAEATDTDAFAILAAMALDSPQFAVRCADNKLMLILMLALQDFDAAAQDDIGRLDPRALMMAFRRLFADMRFEAGVRNDFREAWLALRPARAPHDAEP